MCCTVDSLCIVFVCVHFQRGPYVVKAELILQIAERKVVQQDRALFTSNRKKEIKKYFGKKKTVYT